MSLIVETGAVVAGAESYASVAQADAYHTARGNASSWSALAVDVKEGYLRRATDYMLQAYRSRWGGSRLGSVQVLDWPRYGAYQDGFIVSSTIVPVIVVNACAELALRAKTGELAPDVKREVLEKTVGPIKTVYAQGAKQSTRFAAVDLMLAPLLGSSNRLVRA